MHRANGHPSHVVLMFIIAVTRAEVNITPYTLTMHQQRIAHNTKIANVFFLGEPKAGTTSLNKLVGNHPEVCCPRIPVTKKAFSWDHASDHIEKYMKSRLGRVIKEAHFFDRIYTASFTEAHRPNNTDSFGQEVTSGHATRTYSLLYRHCKSADLMIDSTPGYLTKLPALVRLIRMYRGLDLSPKFVIIVREPVSRALSWLNHICRSKQRELRSQTFATWFWNDAYVRDYRVGKSIKALIESFGRKSILLLTKSYLFGNTTTAMKLISDFLNIRFPNNWKHPLTHSNEGRKFHTLNSTTCSMLRNMSSHFREDQKLLESLMNMEGKPKMQPHLETDKFPPTMYCIGNDGMETQFGELSLSL